MSVRLYVWESVGIVLGTSACVGSVWLLIHNTTALWIVLLGFFGGASWVVRGVKQLVRYSTASNRGFEVKLTSESPVGSEKERDNDHG